MNEVKRLQKADFHNIYNQPLPDSYFQALAPLDYQIPEQAQKTIEEEINAIRQRKQTKVIRVLDICCGYGINAMLLTHTLTMDEINRYFTQGHRPGASTEDDVKRRFEKDREFFSLYRTRQTDIRVLGLDVAHHALSYAEDMDLLECGHHANLETDSVPLSLAIELPTIDLITVTGGLSYIGQQTFHQLLSRIPPNDLPSICCFPLRTTDCQGMIDTFHNFGLAISAHEDNLLPQRRFASPEERNSTMSILRTMGHEVTLEDQSNFLYARVVTARPKEADKMSSLQPERTPLLQS